MGADTKTVDVLAPSGIGELDARTEDCAEYLRFQRAISHRAAALRTITGVVGNE
ncbi:hypothetical protein [Pseudoxanthomonas sp. PXM05]|uniref:hypothetical protein n=1 Tax=Pseudoxanthomonas sp. PXM05 TaxID=2854775 RepID=UPI001C43AF19|nr:hypothetical protein [Pseudoxanthomonas sp. PXM05]MBV7475364.1 hypothetical protein [Pseudoxanthomonas sp. PXM05]